MPLLPTIRIGPRLALSFAVVLALLLVLAGLALARLHELAGAFERLSGEQLERVQLASDVARTADEAARKLLVLLSAPRERRVRAYTEIDAAHRELDALMASLAQRLPGGAQHAALSEVRQAVLHYRAAYGDTVDEIEAQDLDLARRLMDERTDPALSSLVIAIQALAHGEQQAAEQVAAAFKARIRQDVRIVLALCLAALMIGTGLAFAVTRSIVRPLDQAVAAARRMAEGDYTPRIAVTTDDEVGRVSRALNALAEAVDEREARIRRLANTLVCVDVDRLKLVNAILGFDAGDAVIGEAAQRLAACLGAQAPMTRLAGGTFAALVPLGRADDAPTLAATLQRAAASKVQWGGYRRATSCPSQSAPGASGKSRTGCSNVRSTRSCVGSKQASTIRSPSTSRRTTCRTEHCRGEFRT